MVWDTAGTVASESPLWGPIMLASEPPSSVAVVLFAFDDEHATSAAPARSTHVLRLIFRSSRVGRRLVSNKRQRGPI
jgi:hypothetical protein